MRISKPTLCREEEGQSEWRRNSHMHSFIASEYGRWHGNKDIESKLGNLSWPASTRPSGKDLMDEENKP
jgi:hypothetical protein